MVQLTSLKLTSLVSKILIPEARHKGDTIDRNVGKDCLRNDPEDEVIMDLSDVQVHADMMQCPLDGTSIRYARNGKFRTRGTIKWLE